MGSNELTAKSYNAMIPYIHRYMKVEDTPFYKEMTKFEIELYNDTMKELEEERAKYPGVPICLEPMEKDWD